MGPDTMGGPGQIVATVIAVAVVLGVMLLRNARPRKLRVELLWLRPVLFALIIAATLSASPVPMTLLSLSVLALAVLLGAGLGWQRGRFMKIEVDTETHALTSRASPVGVLFIVAILGLRILLRGAALEARTPFGLPASAITDGLVLLIGAMVVTQSLEMWLRARRLLSDARAAKAMAAPGGARSPIVSR